MDGEQIRSFRQSMGWERNQLAAVLSEALGRTVSLDAVGRYERGARTIPADVAAFVSVAAESGGDYEVPPPAKRGRPRSEDSAPGGDGPPAKPILPIPGGSYAAVCEQFFELIATGVGMIGVALGSPALRADGETILEDKQKLGAAYGKLAETNETFRNMLMATDKQGAYLAVALATGTTAGRLWRNHAAPAQLHVVDSAEQLRDDLGRPDEAAADDAAAL